MRFMSEGSTSFFDSRPDYDQDKFPCFEMNLYPEKKDALSYPEGFCKYARKKESGQLVGIAQVKINKGSDGKLEATIAEIVVSESERGKGLGSMML